MKKTKEKHQENSWSKLGHLQRMELEYLLQTGATKDQINEVMGWYRQTWK